ncbi:hypothetical protein GGR52DRAFT_514288 [Hypoxylon sp. FL1284]|nr:hypothetical protein GGR52DRAFT_514288 [Hypoxylon sp. FL1284]
MAFQISIGDVVLMTQIAWRLAQTFTKGRKSAPTEFHEVENQLYSLNAALEATKSACERGDIDSWAASPESVFRRSLDQTEGLNIVDGILKNCRQTLEHLEKIVQKYSIIREPALQSSTSKLGIWNQYVTRNWRKIEWTTEKGDLDTLRSQIMVHTNSLNLLLGIITNSQSTRILKSVEKTSDMVKELYEWYGDNLKRTRRSKGSDTPMNIAPVNTASDITAALSHMQHTFELATRTGRGRSTLCPKAYFIRDGDEYSASDTSSTTANPMFGCSCRNYEGSGLHQTTVERYEQSHLTFPIRLAAAERSWIIYKAVDRATNQLVILYLVNINPSYIQILEETFLRDLVVGRANMTLSQGSSNSLICTSADTEEKRILALIGELNTAQKSVESVTFTHGGRSQSRNWVDNIEILQYQTMNLNMTTAGQTKPLCPMEYAEVLISYDEQDEEKQDDVTSNVLYLQRRTALELDESNALLRIDSIDVTGTFEDERSVKLDGLSVTIQLTSREAARELHKKLEDMRMELFVTSLQQPRSDETVALRLQVARVECDSIYISGADVMITTDAQGQHRLIIESHNRCTIVSQVLVDNFFDSPPGKPDYSGLTYVVQIEGDGKRNVYKYERGFRYLNLRNPQADRMLELAWRTMSIGSQPGSSSAGPAEM